MRLVRMALCAAALLAGALAFPIQGLGETSAGSRVALMIEIDGAIGPATARQIKDGLASAHERNAEVVILRLNTPGGLATSMREIIADILASPVPVIGYVAPSGSHAASAGTYILYATHVAAMAPGTNIGAATPVEIGTPFPSLPGGGEQKPNEKPGAAPAQDTLAIKATNDAVALIRSLAELRGRNADWGEKAVREAASLSAQAALDQRVIDLMANDTAALLQAIDGRKITTTAGPRNLAMQGLKVETIEPGWLIRLLAVITDPNIAVLLMLLGVYGLVFEFMSPGAVAPGVIGAICLVLGLYALNLLPIDYTGLALMLLGLTFLVVEAIYPTVVLGAGGLVAFLLGAAMLLRVQPPGYRLSWTLIAIAAMLIAALLLLSGRFLWRTRGAVPRIGRQAMRGLPAEILDWSEGSGHVLAEGERWSARSNDAFTAGERAEIVDIDGLILTLRRGPKTGSGSGEPP
jgi:membrane-bound serine protease (ClpP class)